MLCNYTHANYSAISRNLKEEGISISPEYNQIKEALDIMNAIYYNYIDIICKIFNVDIGWGEIPLDSEVESLIKAFNTHRNVVDFFAEYVPGLTKKEFRKQYSVWYKKR